MKAFKSILRAWKEVYVRDSNSSMEILVVDDGALSDNTKAVLTNTSKENDIIFVYHKKKIQGLYSSRIETIKVAQGELIVFLDDDVELDTEYLVRLCNAYKDKSVGGFGGVDQRLAPATKRILVYQWIFLHSSRFPGYLSITGFNGSITKWPIQKVPFKANFLSGCNMSFRKELLIDLPSQTIFSGYSIGEDIFISRFVSLKSVLIIDPLAKINHNQAEHSRDATIIIARSTIENYGYMFSWFKYSLYRFPLFLWSCLGLAIKATYDLLKSLVKMKGYRIINDYFKQVLGCIWGIERILIKHNGYSLIVK